MGKHRKVHMFLKAPVSIHTNALSYEFQLTPNVAPQVTFCGTLKKFA